jgi:hypothetical protein
MLDMLREALPVFVSVTLCAALVEPVLCWPNVRLVAERLAMGAAGGGGLLPPPPPPQATQTPTTSSAVANSQPGAGRRAAPQLKNVARASNPANSQGHPTGRRKVGGALRGGAGDTELTGPCVVTVSVAVTAEELAMLTDDGEMVQFTPTNPVKQDRAIVPLKPFRGVRVTVDVPDCPGAEMVKVVGFADMV